MKIGDKYFCNVLDYGDLYLDYILIEEDFHLLFLLKNKNGERFICACFEIKQQESWVLNKISVSEIKKLLSNDIDIRQAFLVDNDNGKKIIITEKNNIYTYKIVNKEYLIGNDILLEEGDYLEAEDDEFLDYINMNLSV